MKHRVLLPSQWALLGAYSFIQVRPVANFLPCMPLDFDRHQRKENGTHFTNHMESILGPSPELQKDCRRSLAVLSPTDHFSNWVAFRKQGRGR
jgi:hypothetical protein